MIKANKAIRLPRGRASLSIATALLLLATSTAATSQTNGEGAPGMSGSLLGIDKAVHSFLAANGYPGATVAVTRAGRLVWNKGYGVADKAAGTEMQPWHRSRIGSVSKMLTALAALKLAEAGTLNLNQSIYGDPGAYVSNNDPWPGNGITWGVLQNTGDYWDAMKTGVGNLNEQNFFNAKMNETIDWAKQITVPHLLSHTSGFLGSGDVAGAAAYFKKSEDQVTYKEAHLFVLMGLRKNKDGLIPPFASAPGTQWDYSNHGPGIVGMMIVDELAGPGVNFRQYVEQNVLHPLGLTDVVPNNTSISKLDAFPHGSEIDPNNPSTLGLASGGWVASAGDLVRVMCGIDRGSNNLRLLSHATVKTMESDVAPSIAGRPMGWDWRSGNKLSKNGSTGGGISLVQKFLPGEVSDDEINVAVAINSSGGPMPNDLIQLIAEAAASAYIPSEYDLFDPAYRCYNPGPQRFDITSVTLTGFYPAGTSNPMPAKIAAKCPVNINLKGTFHHIGKGKVEYRFRFLVEKKASTTFSTVIKGDPKDPLYEQPTVTHTIQLPLPAAINPGGKGGAIPKGPGGFQLLEQPEEPIFPGKPKGPAVPGKVVAQQPGSGIKGTVRLEVLTPSGGLMSNPVHYDIECEPEMEILSGTVQLRDESQKAPACPRPATVAVSIRTNKAGQVSYVLACTGDDRTWKGSTMAYETGPDTFIAIPQYPIQIAKQEDVTCVLRKGEQFGFSDVIATGKRQYPCKVTGITTPTPLPPPVPPLGLKQPEPPAPPRLVCVGGRVVGQPQKPSCTCPAGKVAKQTAPNRFECETQLVCEGGRIVNRGRPPEPSCVCPAGMTAEEVVTPELAHVRGLAKAKSADDSDPDHFRCIRKPTVPENKSTKTSAPKVTCAGGVVRSNVCVCPRGTTLQTGVCRAPARVR